MQTGYFMSLHLISLRGKYVLQELKKPILIHITVSVSPFFTSRFPTLNRWIQMQTNLHRVSEVAITAEERANDGKSKPEIRTAIKRVREPDSDTESEVDDIAGNTNVSAASDHSVKDSSSLDLWGDSLESETAEVDNTVFLSFDWENEDPYEKAVERYYSFVFLLRIPFFPSFAASCVCSPIGLVTTICILNFIIHLLLKETERNKDI